MYEKEIKNLLEGIYDSVRKNHHLYQRPASQIAQINIGGIIFYFRITKTIYEAEPCYYHYCF